MSNSVVIEKAIKSYPPAIKKFLTNNLDSFVRVGYPYTEGMTGLRQIYIYNNLVIKTESLESGLEQNIQEIKLLQKYNKLKTNKTVIINKKKYTIVIPTLLAYSKDKTILVESFIGKPSYYKYNKSEFYYKMVKTLRIDDFLCEKFPDLSDLHEYNFHVDFKSKTIYLWDLGV